MLNYLLNLDASFVLFSSQDMELTETYFYELKWSVITCEAKWRCHSEQGSSFYCHIGKNNNTLKSLILTFRRFQHNIKSFILDVEFIFEVNRPGPTAMLRTYISLSIAAIGTKLGYNQKILFLTSFGMKFPET